MRNVNASRASSELRGTHPTTAYAQISCGCWGSRGWGCPGRAVLLLWHTQEVIPHRSQPCFGINPPKQDIKIFWLDSKRTCGDNRVLQPADCERLINIWHTVWDSIPYVERQKKVEGYVGEWASLSEEKMRIIELHLYYSKCDCS